jgi:S1-C subfamily serine protease
MVFQGREGQSRQMTMEIAGTLVKPSGLTVVSNFSSNPGDLAPSREEGPKLEAEITDAKLILHDGRELAAKVVLRDQDLDLAFLMPDEKGLALPYVPLEKAKVPEVLDDIIFLYPLGKSLNREVAVAFGKVRAVTRRPRVFIVSDLLNGIQSLGCPVFGADGQPVGLVVLRRPAVTPNGGGVRDFLDIMNPVVLTAEDVQQVAAQASTSKP